MFSKMSKRTNFFVLLGILCIALLAGGIFVYPRYTTETVQERIYVVPERSERQTAPPPTDFQQEPASTAMQIPAAEQPHHEYVEHTHNHDSIPSNYVDESDFFPIGISEPENITSNEDDDSTRLTDLTTQIEVLTIELGEKYPELTELAYLSLDEINELYPTPEALADLGKRAQKAQAEFMGAVSALFSELPADVREECLSAAREMFVASWGAETADAVMSDLRSQLGQ